MAVSARQVKNKRDADGKLTGRAGTVYDVNVKYKNAAGERKAYVKKGFVTKREAQQHEAEMKTKLLNPQFIEVVQSKNNQTVKEYLNNWLETHVHTNLRPGTYSTYSNIVNNYIIPNVGNVQLSKLTPVMLDKMFKKYLDSGLKPSTVLTIKRLLSVSLEHARKYRYIETNAAKDTLTKLSPTQNTAPPFNVEQMKTLLTSVSNTIWEMPILLGGLYGLRRSEIAGLRWHNVDLQNNTFEVVEQLPFKLPSKTQIVEEMAPTKSKASMRQLPITEYAKPFFEKQLKIQEMQKNYAAENQLTYYDNDLVVAKPDGTPVLPDWISSQFGKVLDALNLPHTRFHDLRHGAATNMHQLTGDFFTVGEILGHTCIAASLGMSLNFEMVTSRYVDVRMERKKQVIDVYHTEVDKARVKPVKPMDGKTIPSPKQGKYIGFEL
ncbi:MAG: site-specific integrase [bacterium]|nr:site-specific integrase [bacterium]